MLNFFCSATNFKFLFYGLITLFVFQISCKDRINKKLPKEETYFLFKHINEIVDEENITTGYQLLNSTLTRREVDTLKVILKKYGWKYKVADKEILISTVAMQDLDELLFLDSELEKRVRDSSRIIK